MSRRAFTLVEAMLGSTLGFLLLAVLVLTLIPLLRYASWHTARSTLVQSTTLIGERLGADLQKAPLSGIRLPSAAMPDRLSIHPIAAVTDTGLPVWDTTLILYRWEASAGALRRASWSPVRDNLALGPFLPGPQQLAEAFEAPATAPQTLVSGLLKEFSLQCGPGQSTPLQLRLVTELPVVGREHQRLELTQSLGLRNEGY